MVSRPADRSPRFGILLRPVSNVGAIRRPAPGLRQSLRFCQVKLTLPQLLFRAFAILYIDTRSVPFEDVPGFVKQRQCAYHEPTVFPVLAPEANLMLHCLRTIYCCNPVRAAPDQVIGMNGLFPIPAQSILPAETREILPSPIHENARAVG